MKISVILCRTMIEPECLKNDFEVTGKYFSHPSVSIIQCMIGIARRININPAEGVCGIPET